MKDFCFILRVIHQCVYSERKVLAVAKLAIAASDCKAALLQWSGRVL